MTTAFASLPLSAAMRDNLAASIVEKVRARSLPTVEARFAPQVPFGFRTNYGGASDEPFSGGIPLVYGNKVSYVRPDQLERLHDWVDRWKVLIPISIAWVIVVGVTRYLLGPDGSDVLAVLVAFGFAAFLLIIASYVAQIRRDKRAEAAEAAEASFVEPVDPFAGGHPVPPMPGQELLEPSTVPAVEQEPRNA